MQKTHSKTIIIGLVCLAGVSVLEHDFYANLLIWPVLRMRQQKTSFQLMIQL